jgi:tyrosinase
VAIDAGTPGVRPSPPLVLVGPSVRRVLLMGAEMASIRRRLDVWGISKRSEHAAKTEQWDPVLRDYADGVDLLMKRGGKANRNTTPTMPLEVESWQWMANTHLTPVGQKQMQPLWGSCAHHDRYFLVWHRAYLAWFETTIRTLINKPEWALPYWDYSDPARPETLELPWEFRVPKRTVGGKLVDNPLYVDLHDRPGHPRAKDTAIGRAMSERFFIREFPAKGFGGVDGPRNLAGHLEAKPHDVVHDSLGGIMGDVSLSARDPIFWLHHANLDRLWEVWRQLDGSVDVLDQGGISQQLATEWRNARFAFGGKGSITVYSVDDVMDTTTEPLNYEYEVTTLPPAIESKVLRNRKDARTKAIKAAASLSPPRIPWIMKNSRGLTGEVSMGPEDTTPPQENWNPVASTLGSTEVGDQGADHALAFDARQMASAGPLSTGVTTFLTEDSPALPEGIIIALMGVRAPVDCYGHYVVGVGAKRGSPIHEADTFSTFGLNGTRPEEERNYTIDATDLIPELDDDGWDGGQLVVQVRPETLDENAETRPQGLVIGQIIVYLQR